MTGTVYATHPLEQRARAMVDLAHAIEILEPAVDDLGVLYAHPDGWAIREIAGPWLIAFHDGTGGVRLWIPTPARTMRAAVEHAAAAHARNTHEEITR